MTECRPDRPRISVVVPALNEAGSIGACLSALQAQDYGHGFEVIVVDNGSTDATGAIAASHGARVVVEPGRGVCRARQAGTAAARGEIVVSTDADTTVEPDWLSRIDRTFADRPDAVATCGPCRFVDAPWWGTVYPKILFGVTALIHRLFGAVIYASATNIAFRRSAWTGYDLRLTQGGDELGLLRSLRRSGRIHFDPARVTLTSSRRLNRGLVYNLFVTCLFFYFGAYLLNRLFGRTVVGSAPTIRTAGRVRHGSRIRRVVPALGVACALATVAWLGPVHVA